MSITMCRACLVLSALLTTVTGGFSACSKGTGEAVRVEARTDGAHDPVTLNVRPVVLASPNFLCDSCDLYLGEMVVVRVLDRGDDHIVFDVHPRVSNQTSHVRLKLVQGEAATVSVAVLEWSSRSGVPSGAVQHVSDIHGAVEIDTLNWGVGSSVVVKCSLAGEVLGRTEVLRADFEVML